MKSFFHDVCHVPHIFNQKVVLDDGPGNADRVTFLKSIKPNGSRGHLTTDDHHGNAVHVGGGNACHRIGQAWA